MKAAIALMLFIGVVWTPCNACAESARSLVMLGNKLYAARDFDKALEAYDQALNQLPDSGEIYFNKGNAFFSKGDFEKAREAFQAAAMHTRDLSLEASAHYNLGNTIFSEGRKQLETDPKKALSQWEQSIHHYQEALRIDPNRNDAGQNMEVVRIAMKDLADRIKKAEEAAREQQKQQEELQKRLKEVLKEQESEIEANESLQKKAEEGSESPTDEEARRLASEQEKTRQKTQDVADQLKALSPPPQQPPNSQQQMESPGKSALDHLEKAQGAQRDAVEKLQKKNLQDALKDQQEALENLKEALKEPEDSKKENSQCPNPQPGGQGDEGTRDKDRQQEAADRPSDKAKEEPAKPQEQEPADRNPQPRSREQGNQKDANPAPAPFSESPENIFREEKENRLQLYRTPQGGIKPVEKDW